MDIPDLDRSIRLHDTLAELVREHGPRDHAWLARRARRVLRDATLSEHAVVMATDLAQLVVVRPDGLVVHIGDVLDGIVLTQRIRGDLTDRTDLWLGAGAEVFLRMAEHRPLPLASGGAARASKSVEPVLLGPPGWLPRADRGDLVGLRWAGGFLEVGRIAIEDLAGPSEQGHVRTLMSERCEAESWFNGDDPDDRARQVVQALAKARLEDRQLLSTPHPPLDELLYHPLDTHERDHFRDAAATRQQESVSFGIDRMPVALDMELRSRAEQYGMSLDQFVIAILGHLAWRTPFAEDMEPWEQWDPDAQPRASLSVLPNRST